MRASQATDIMTLCRIFLHVYAAVAVLPFFKGCNGAILYDASDDHDRAVSCRGQAEGKLPSVRTANSVYTIASTDRVHSNLERGDAR
jgi:hypothetical protein